MEIKPTYVTFHQAKLLKEKGFRVQCLEWFDKDGNPPPNKFTFIRLSEYEMKDIYIQPEQWQVVEWLRVKHGIWVYAEIASLNTYRPKAYELEGDKFGIWEGHKYMSPQEAYSSAFDYVLKELL